MVLSTITRTAFNLQGLIKDPEDSGLVYALPAAARALTTQCHLTCAKQRCWLLTVCGPSSCIIYDDLQILN